MSELGSHKGEGNRYVMYLSAPAGGIAQMLRNPEGNWVPYEDYARLKAEVERLTEGNECLDQMHEKEMARSAFLCEEVNRTTAWGRGLESDLSWARAELMQVKAELERVRLIAHDNKQALYNAKAEVERLKEDNRQLTKAFEIAEGIIKRMGKAAEDAAKEVQS
jgi:hypothetical protein